MRPENRALLTATDVVLAAHPGSGASWIGTLLTELGVFYMSGHDELLVDRTSQRTGGWIEPDASTNSSPSGHGIVRPTLSSSSRSRHLPALHGRDEAGRSYREPLRVVLSNQSALGGGHEGRVLLLVRDGRDAVLSLYHYLRSFSGLDVPLEAFLAGNEGAWPPPAQSWAVSNLSWAGATPTERLHVVRFEDARAQPLEVFGHMLAFLGVERDTDELERAIDAASYGSMRAREDRELAAAGEGSGTGRVMRRGQIGEWREVYTPDMLATFEGLGARALAHFGYPSAADPRSDG